MSFLEPWLAGVEADLRAADLLREPPVVERVRGPLITIKGRELLHFGSNDYLGLAQHRIVVTTARADAFGWGAGSSRLIAGTTKWHAMLEEKLAEFLNVPAALYFSSGSAANAGLITAVADKDSVILSDALNHASVVDACRLSRARIQVYPHGDIGSLDELLGKATEPRKFIVSDTVFSMDGDLAALGDLKRVAEWHKAELLLDDAHGFGVLGPNGRGAPELFDVQPVAWTGNFAKAAGGIGGFVAGSAALKRVLTTKARSFMFTTALPAAAAVAGLAALEQLKAMPDARTKLMQNARALGSKTPIHSIVLGDAKRAVEASQKLAEMGYFVPAVRPPSVPENGSRLRVTVTALHEPAHIEGLKDALKKL